ncbi:tRNA-modifying protein YgfZ [mine drainage metagenome]|uniref:tRNA-modifying protein YgfZ n=1 Tax=mine drainage metagenome TaxID=410659 RepID=A0A1J5QNA2_9ZZZZ
MNPLWQDFLARQGAQLSGDRVNHFGNPVQERQAATQGTIIADLSHFGLLQVDGPDAVTFLQGQVTNDVKLLDGSNSQYAGYCTPKGRLLAIFLAFRHRDLLHLQLNGALTESVLKRLKMYVLRSKVGITEVSDSIIRIGLAGAEAEPVLGRVLGAPPQHARQLVQLENASILRLPGAAPRFEIFVAAENAAALWTALQTGCTAVGTECWDWLEIQAGIPEITPATLETFVPQMVNLDRLDGINFKKGCYTGQEIVARTHYLGKVKRRTYLVHIATDQMPQAGDPLFGDDGVEPVGQIVRAAAAPDGGFDALAELRCESVTMGAIRWPAHQGAALSLLALPYPLE